LLFSTIKKKKKILHFSPSQLVRHDIRNKPTRLFSVSSGLCFTTKSCAILSAVYFYKLYLLASAQHTLTRFKMSNFFFFFSVKLCKHDTFSQFPYYFLPFFQRANEKTHDLMVQLKRNVHIQAGLKTGS